MRHSSTADESCVSACPHVRSELLAKADRDNGTRHSAKLSDEMLVRFIRTSSQPASDQSSFDSDTFEGSLSAVRYVNFLAENPALFNQLDGEEFEQFFESGAVRVVRQPDCKGRKIIAIALAKIPAAADGLRLSRCLLYILDRLGRDVQFQVFGVVFLFQCAELSHLDAIQLIARIPFSIFSQLFYAWHNCLPMRWQRTYVFEEPSAVPGVWSVIGSCLTETQRARCVRARARGPAHCTVHASHTGRSLFSFSISLGLLRADRASEHSRKNESERRPLEVPPLCFF